jgi:regulator of protease activity HflC (stomatin/prohibitin superfamily)
MFSLFPRVVFLRDDEQLLVKSLTKTWVVKGPRKYVLRPFWQGVRQKGITLGPTQYLRIRNSITGELRNECGPQMFLPRAHDEIIKELDVIALKHDEYVRIKDSVTGSIRTERGEAKVYLSPTEFLFESKKEVQKGIHIDEKTAVLVRDTRSGQLELVTRKQVFIPESHQEIVEVRERIRLEEHEAVIIIDKDGRYQFRQGSDQERSFFLDPYSRLISLNWSTGIDKSKRDLCITKIDQRPKYMWYEFSARTKDNVDLILGITCFWEVSDVKSMILTTDDAPGDLCSHARSLILQKISQVTLEKFLEAFNEIVHGAIFDNDADTDFYRRRGITLHAVEVRSVTCGDEKTQTVLQEIINETTQRINRMQKQESENEVQMQRIQGEIAAEEKRSKLLDMRRSNARIEGLLAGESESLRVKAFMDGLGDELNSQQKIAIFDSLRRKETFTELSRGSAQLFLVPEGSDLQVRTK